MAIPVEKLERAITKYKNLFIGKEGLKRYRAIIFDTTTILTEETTPRDTGLAKNNWFVQLGTPNLQEKRNYTTPDDIENLSRLSSLKDLKTNVFITNNLEYIEPLEENHSTQTQGQGILKPTVEKTIALIKKNFLKVFK